MKKYINSFLGFLFLNFLGLAIGSLWTDNGVTSQWYSELNKAPWTPSGWVFGFAWTTIMICLSVWNSIAWKNKDKDIQTLYYFSWILNVLWNPIFFLYHNLVLSSFVILILTVLIGFLLHDTRLKGSWSYILLIPYFLWLNIASSLNLYSWIMNQ
jgi:tryptophan-rich sensory protein